MNYKVTIITIAYNAEKYIHACAKSVLNQSYNNIQWLVLDNGCTDYTRKIIEKYIKKDKRIKLIVNQKNYVIFPDENQTINKWIDMMQFVEGEYFTTLDSDDTLDRNFIKKLIDAALDNDADIAAAGTTMFKEKYPMSKGERIPPAFCGSPKEMTTNFSAFYGSFRTLWGKLFKVAIYFKHKKYLHDAPGYLMNGIDTFFCLRFLSVAQKVVCLNESLHSYMIRNDSIYSSNFHSERWKCYDLLYFEARRLLELWNGLTPSNHCFILSVHYYSMIDCIRVLLNVNIAIEDKLQFIQNIVTNKILQYGLAQLNDRTLHDEISRLMLDILSNDDTSEICYKYFIYRLYKANQIKISDQMVGPLCTILYFSALCDKDNSTLWGMEYFKEYESNAIPKWMINLFAKYNLNIINLMNYPSIFCALMNGDFQYIQEIGKNVLDDKYIQQINSAIKSLTINQANYNAILQIKHSILVNFEKDNLEAALNELQKIIAIRIFDEDVIYFITYFNMLIGNRDNGNAYAYSGLAFYDSRPIRKLLVKVSG